MAREKLPDRPMTEWLYGERREPSGFAGGLPISNRDWCERERARVQAKGCRCEVRENKRHPGWFALFRV